MMEDLEITSWTDYQSTPQINIEYRKSIRAARAARAKALAAAQAAALAAQGPRR